MSTKISSTRHVHRIGCAVLASCVTTFVALWSGPGAWAEAPSCTLRDVAAWQAELINPQVERSPDYILRVTQAFLKACPGRPEAQQAHQIAGMAAVDMDRAELGIEHFEQAGSFGSANSRFYFAAALYAAGRTQAAWAMRDQIITDWQRRLARETVVSVRAIEAVGGTIYEVQFNELDYETGVRVAWMAVPDGGGWPATMTLGSDRQRDAFQTLRAGGTPSNAHHIELYRCRSRQLIAEADAALPSSYLQRAVLTALTRYLDRPDGARAPKGRASAEPCLWTDRLLPASPG